MFEKKLKELGIEHKRIHPFTSRYNGKVENSHHKDNEYFYVTYTFYSFYNFKNQLKVYLRKYNNFPMRLLVITKICFSYYCKLYIYKKLNNILQCIFQKKLNYYVIFRIISFFSSEMFYFIFPIFT